MLAVPQHLQFIGAGGIAAPGLRQGERPLRPLPVWRLSSLSPLIASACASQMMRDERDRPLRRWELQQAMVPPMAPFHSPPLAAGCDPMSRQKAGVFHPESRIMARLPCQLFGLRFWQL